MIKTQISELTYCLLLFCLINIACNKSVKNHQLLGSVDTINLTDFKTAELWTNVTIKSVVRLETNENSAIGSIHQMDVYKDFLIIYDLFNNNLLIFNLSGEYLYKIGKIGRGPGEFSDIRGYSIDYEKDEILVMTFEKILTYSLSSGKYISSQIIRLPEDYYNPYRFLKVGLNEFLFWNGNLQGSFSDRNPPYILYGVKDMKVTYKYIIQKDRMSLIPQFIRNGDDFYILPQPTSNMVHIVTNNSVKEAFYINFGENNLPSEISSQPLISENTNEFYKSRYFKGIDSFFVSPSYIYLTCTGPGSYAYEFLYNRSTKFSKARVKLGTFPTILFVDKDGWFYASIDCSTLLRISSLPRSSELNDFLKAAENILDTIRLEDNPIIFKFKVIESSDEK